MEVVQTTYWKDLNKWTFFSLLSAQNFPLRNAKTRTMRETLPCSLGINAWWRGAHAQSRTWKLIWHGNIWSIYRSGDATGQSTANCYVSSKWQPDLGFEPLVFSEATDGQSSWQTPVGLTSSQVSIVNSKQFKLWQDASESSQNYWELCKSMPFQSKESDRSAFPDKLSGITLSTHILEYERVNALERALNKAWEQKSQT